MTEAGAPLRAAPLVGTVLGRHLLVRLLGSGGMGTVYEATHQDLGKRAAVKTLNERYASSPDARQRFLREGQAAAQIRHPNVADVYDVGIDGVHPFLVMELLEGEDLGQLLAREGPLSVQRTADLLVPVVAAVAEAHDHGIVHRDLKPENIFLSAQRSGITPKVLDFGISKLTEEEHAPALTGTGAVLGTPHYMSPEQAQGSKQVDGRSDQYSLGVIAYQCVTGRRPMQNAPLYALMQRIVQGDFPPPGQLTPGLPNSFERLILKAMSRRAERRYGTTRALGEALLAFASSTVRAAYAAELASGAAGQSLPRAASSSALELSSTLGESAHERAIVTPAKPRGLLLAALASILVVAALLISKPWQSPTSVEVATLRTAPPVVAVEPGPRPSSVVSAAPAAPSPVPPASAEPAELLRRAQEQTRLWRLDPQPGGCRIARELWLSYVASVTDPAERGLAERTLAQLGECGAPAKLRRSSAPVVQAASRPAELPPPAAAPSPTAAPARPLPSDDPLDGFVDLGGK